MKWIETTFPFTHPSWELEIEYKGVWYEVLGCGIIEQKILNNGDLFGSFCLNNN
jgi:phenylalanyl-tRNA synthetase alpha chain